MYSIDYNLVVYSIRQLPEFSDWFSGLKDMSTKIRLARRLDKVQRGLLGDVKAVGSGVFEMREQFGPGWRMYYVQRGDVLIVMLGGGDKSTQSADIVRAMELAATIKE
jgi:putative addiction module killer protein